MLSDWLLSNSTWEPLASLAGAQQLLTWATVWPQQTWPEK